MVTAITFTSGDPTISAANYCTAPIHLAIPFFTLYLYSHRLTVGDLTVQFPTFCTCHFLSALVVGRRVTHDIRTFRSVQFHTSTWLYLSSVHSIAVLVWAYNVGELFITAQVGRVYSDERVSERGQNLNHFWIPNLMLLQTTSLQYTQIDRKGELSRYIKPRTPSRELHNSPQAQIQNKPQKPVVWRRSFELTVAKDRVLDDDDDLDSWGYANLTAR